jgi:hypothetical protein
MAIVVFTNCIHADVDRLLCAYKIRFVNYCSDCNHFDCNSSFVYFCNEKSLVIHHMVHSIENSTSLSSHSCSDRITSSQQYLSNYFSAAFLLAMYDLNIADVS